jgi:mono/diheme cytochrome c family protein
MNISRDNLRTAAYVFWPLLILGGLVVLRFTWAGANTGEGAALYQARCANCHGPKGEGFKQLYPAITASPIISGDPAQLACMIQNGVAGTPQANGILSLPMPGQPDLKVHEVTAIVNFLRASWGRSLPPVTAKVVEQGLKSCGDKK